jgi:RNA polymerase sigma-70 factor (ECF subfamily)
MKEPLSLCNEKTFRETYEKYSKGLYRFLYFSYGDQEKSEDIAQEVFAKLWQRCSEFHSKNIKSLIFTMGKNLMLNEIQKAKVKLNFQSENISYESAPSPEFELEEREFEISLNDAINQLTVNEREVFLLNRIEQFTYAEIADRLELSQKAIEKRMHSALKKLQHELNISLKRK